MTLKKSLAVTTAAALALSLAACSSDSSSDSSSSSSGSEGGDNYVLVNGTEPQNPLVPGNTNEVGGGRIVDSIFSGLVYYDVDGSPVNDVAESIELEGDKTYRITIKDGQTFTDGTPVTAESFVNAWNYNVANSTLSSYFFESILGYEEGVESMEGLKVVDDTTFTVELTQPESDFPLRLGYSAFFPLPDSALEDMAAFGENPVGNGPYKLLEWNHNQDATIVPNEDYDGGRAAQNDGVKFVFYPTFDSAYADLLSDNLDVLDSIPDSAFSTFEDELSGRSINQASAVFQSFTIPERLEHFSGEEGVLRRQAISLAVNRDEITQTIFEGTRTPATDFTSPVIAGHSDSLTGADVLTYDPDRAKDLWAQADAINPWSGEFTISYNADGGHQAWVDATANSIRNTLGIDALGNPYPDFKSLRDDVTNRTINGAFRTGWQADYPSLGNFLGPLYGTGAGSNDGDYSNPDFDAKLAEAANAADVDASTPLYNEAQEILLQDLPAIPTWYSNAVGGYSTNVDNVEFQWNSQPAYYQITKN
ncbi:ABC transporter substrate-binding protein [[Brevibacterium] flavum]|uniref:ABC transporter substrate-binding protein n=1 Tax=[Brevibacterium] flavum TaxID=92706 RepID=A0A0F6WQS1_9CORY|nr:MULTISPECIES: ABC transporter substrate-binding protein [Corynebacterium]AKF27732.1 ABC transporter substrate-binding protein [[Brevibacterium] flavum]AST20977.1 ABC transporter substrate-binding protein [Corynebacterium glutamicum ATCC 14067]KEI23484.1 ABC transporter substrate-binding protein [Corynebacterium glutamicum ATCC 14067]KIH73231.1 ABC transporter substrate-binding protein [Corynebacterium glutamicum]